MKKVIAILGLVLLTTASAFAATTGRVQIFEGITFEEIKPQLEAAGALKNGQFSTHIVTDAAAQLLRAQGKTELPAALVSRKYQEYYKIPATMTGAQFNAAKFYVDDNFVADVNGKFAAQQVAAATPVVSAPAVAAPAAPVKVVTPVQPNDADIWKAVHALNGGMDRLKANGVDVSALRAEMKNIAAAQVRASTKGQYEKLAGQLSGMLTKTNERLSALEGQVGKLEKAQAATAKSVTNLETGLKETDGNVATLTKLQLEDRTAIKNLETGLKSAGGTSPWTWVALFGSVIAIGFAFLRKRGGMTEEQVDSHIDAKLPQAVAPFERRADDKTADAENRLTVLEEEVGAIRRDGNIQKVQFGPSFDKAVSALKAGAKCVVWEAEIVGYPETWSLVIHNVGEGMVSVEGVKELTDAISLQSLQGKIGRAGQPWKRSHSQTLPHRFVGVKEEDLPGFQAAEVADFAETQSESPQASEDPLMALNKAISGGLGQVRPADDLEEEFIPSWLRKAKAA